MNEPPLTFHVGQRVREQMQKVICGQESVIDHCLAGLLTRGHVLLEGVPGTAKTLIVRVLARTLGCQFKRVQMTPDLMPADILGTNIYDPGTGKFRLRRGPIFTNLLLADEINRAPAKTQAALLEAMEEGVVTIDGEDYRLEEPFMVFATQNPIEHEGTYPLPEAELDRFMFKVIVDYPARETEARMLRMHNSGFDPRDLDSLGIEQAADRETLLRCRREVIETTVQEAILDYILQLVAATRESPLLRLGGSPRSAAVLLLASKAFAVLAGRRYVIPEDVIAAALPTLRHRIILQPEAELDGITPDMALKTIIESIPVPR